MPFLGLLDTNGREITIEGYHRIDMSEIEFKCSPAQETEYHLTFVNKSQVEWDQAKRNWPLVPYLAIYNEIDDKDPMAGVPLDNAQRVLKGERLAFGPGGLRIPHKIKNHS